MQACGAETLIDGISQVFWLSFHDIAEEIGKEEARRLNDEEPAVYVQTKRRLMASRMMDAGVIPPWFQQAARCEKCGDVFIDVEGPPDPEFIPQLSTCPWCEAFDLPRQTHAAFVAAAQKRHADWLAAREQDLGKPVTNIRLNY